MDQNQTENPDLHLVLIDGSGFIFRAYHALPFMSGPQGVPVNAVYGFTNMLARFLRERVGTHLAVIFDAARETFRNEIYPPYKSHRPEVPEDLKPQFALVRQATGAFGIPGLEQPGWEADDLIAAYARMVVEKGGHCTIVSSDKDLMQLIRPGVRMLDPIKNKSIGPQEVYDRFGVGPEKIVEIQALMGDSVDNVPGVPGIGPKNAAALIQEYGDLEGVIAAIPSMKPSKRRENLENNIDQARISHQLVTLRDDAPCPAALDQLLFKEPDPKKLGTWLDEMEFRSIAQRLSLVGVSGKTEKRVAPETADFQITEEAAQISSSVEEWKTAPYYENYETLTTHEQLDQWIDRIKKQGYFALDTETTSLDPLQAQLVGISMAFVPGKACYIPLGHTHAGAEADLLDEKKEALRIPSQLSPAAVREKLVLLLADPGILKIFQNAKYDLLVLKQAGYEEIHPIDDTMLISYVQSAGAHGQGMDELAMLHLDHKAISYDEVTGTGGKRISFAEVSLEDATRYAAEDADITLRLWLALKPSLRQHKVLSLYEMLERPLIPVLAQMEETGICVDAAELKSISAEFTHRMADMEEKIHALAGRSFNLASPKQLGEILFDEMGIPGGKKTKTGSWSTDSNMLQSLAEQGYDLPTSIQEWRQLAKLKSTYTDALLKQINPRTRRVHTSFQMAVTSTGRLSSNEPNLQNIPIRTEEGVRIRQAFVAGAGYQLLSADYSQIELRLLAHVANIPALKEAFLLNQDIHARTASEVFGVPMEGMPALTRRRAKAINFGIIYGISAFGLGRQLGISPGEAKNYIDTYFKRYPGIRDYMERAKEEARAKGYVLTPFGRPCWVGDMHVKNAGLRAYAERQAINAPLQGGAADIIKRAMVQIAYELPQTAFNARMLLQVHDELLFEIDPSQAAEFSVFVKKIMENVTSLSVPLVVETGRGQNWAKAH